MSGVFHAICKALNLRIEESWEQTSPRQTRCNVFLQQHSQFDLKCFGSDFRGLHLVRDPRDMLVSATFYHRHSDEPWLHTPRESLGGLSYRQKIETLQNFDEELSYSMNLMWTDLQRIRNFNYADVRFRTLHYEHLIADRQLNIFEDLFHFLGFHSRVIDTCLVNAYRNCLFSSPPKSAHVRSGEPKQWPHFFKPIHKEQFTKFFGDILQKSGYEENWDLVQIKSE